MDVGELYQFVLILVLIGILLGVSFTVLGNLSSASGVTNNASTAINQTISALGTIPSTWLTLIVTIAVLAIVLTLVLRAFANRGR